MYIGKAWKGWTNQRCKVSYGSAMFQIWNWTRRSQRQWKSSAFSNLYIRTVSMLKCSARVPGFLKGNGSWCLQKSMGWPWSSSISIFSISVAISEAISVSCRLPKLLFQVTDGDSHRCHGPLFTTGSPRLTSRFSRPASSRLPEVRWPFWMGEMLNS